MLVAIVALTEYAKWNGGKYQSTVDKWLQMAKTEWIDEETGLLASKLTEDGWPIPPVRGAFSALSCSYLAMVDQEFAKGQYELLKKHFKKDFPFTGIMEYTDRKCRFDFENVDAGPVILDLSASGTAFAIGCATMLGDMKFRNQLLRTAEIAGSTVTWNGKSHYLLANWVLVGEAVALAMRTATLR